MTERERRRRRARIAQRAGYLEHLATMPDLASLARDPTASELGEFAQRGHDAGAREVAKRRGII
jgi:hypothetical protein